MFSKKQLIVISLAFAIAYHFVTYFELYGPRSGLLHIYFRFLLALIPTLILIYCYFVMKWRSDLKGNFIVVVYDLLIVWIFFSFFRSLFDVYGSSEMKGFLLSEYKGLSLFPVLFFIVGMDSRNFSLVNRILFFYCVVAWLFSLIYFNSFELQLFLLLPIFYVIVTYPIQSGKDRLLTLVITVSIIAVSLTNRAGVSRLLISYLIVIVYLIIVNLKINKKIVNIMVFCILMLPFYFLYLGLNGKSIFETVLNDNSGDYSHTNLKLDTRTFLYYEVFQDLKFSKAYVYGKGINGGYRSDTFNTLSRYAVEVGFLQLLLKTGVIGFLLYMILVFSAIYKALTQSNNMYIKCLGLLLSSYALMIFIENVIVFNLLNIVVWFCVGMCHSDKLRSLNNLEIKELYLGYESSK